MDTLNEVKKAMEFKKWDNGKEGYIISDSCTGDTKNELMRLIYDENIGGVSDLSYEIVAKATELFEDIENLEQLNEENENESEQASIYTAIRLSYLNNFNEQEISDILKEYNTTDISTACAIWYDNMVRQAYDELKAYILK